MKTKTLIQKITSLLATFSLLFFINACGKQANENQTQELSIANALINTKEFEAAISFLEEEISKDPSARELRIKLAHAYAGAAGFEAIKMSKMIKRFKDSGLKGIEILKNLEVALSEIPSFNEKRKERLNQSIELYKKLDLSPYSASHENNFKWGTLHTYRLLITAKEISQFIKNVIEDKSRYTKNEVESFLIGQGDHLAQDLYRSYQLFRKSFEKIQLKTKDLETIVKSAAKKDQYELKIRSKAETYKNFIKDLIQGNKETVSLIIVKLTGKINRLNIDSNIKNIVQVLAAELGNGPQLSAELLEKAEEIKEEGLKKINLGDTIEKIESQSKEVKNKINLKLNILVKMIIEEIKEDLKEEGTKLKSIFNTEFKLNFQETIQLILEQRSLHPLNTFLERYSEEVEVITQSWNIINSNQNRINVREIVNPEVKKLLKLIDKEALRLEELSKENQKRAQESLAKNKDELDLIIKKGQKSQAKVKEGIPKAKDQLKDELDKLKDKLKEAI